MSVLSLCRHKAKVYRKVVTRGSVFREPKRYPWAVQIPSLTCEVQKKPAARGRGERIDTGGGEISDGDWIVYVPDTTADVVAGDVLVTTSGDNHPLTLEIQHRYGPRGNHLEYTADVWEGSLT